MYLACHIAQPPMSNVQYTRHSPLVLFDINKPKVVKLFNSMPVLRVFLAHALRLCKEVGHHTLVVGDGVPGNATQNTDHITSRLSRLSPCALHGAYSLKGRDGRPHLYIPSGSLTQTGNRRNTLGHDRCFP